MCVFIVWSIMKTKRLFILKQINSYKFVAKGTQIVGIIALMEYTKVTDKSLETHSQQIGETNTIVYKMICGRVHSTNYVASMKLKQSIYASENRFI